MSKRLILLLFCVSATLTVSYGWTDTKQRKFKDEFLFGAASSAYQVEGGWDADGKGESIWDRFVHNASNEITGGATGDIAADSYNLYGRDVEMLRELGVDFYRFSISWSRVLPTGLPDNINEAGLQYYDNLIDELLKYNIEPMVTLYHWDLPQNLQDLGGWTDSRVVQWFEDYARIVFKRYSSKVKYWITINQPNTICVEGYGTGMIAPGIVGFGQAEYVCIKNVLLAHATAWKLYDREFRKRDKGQIGITISINWFDPITNTTENFKKTEEIREFSIGLFTNPIFSKDGDFPETVKNIVGKKSKEQGFKKSRLPELSAEEIKLLKGSSDFLGMNHYTTFLVEPGSGEDISPSIAHDVDAKLSFGEKWEESHAFWLRSVPYGLYKACLWLNKQYDYPKVFITENGWATGQGYNDKGRVDYVRKYLDALLLAIDDGTRCLGYTYWSLMDNFEWIFGYSDRFGLYEVSFDSEEKTRKARFSALAYRNIIETRKVDHKWKPKNLKINLSERRISMKKDEL